MHCEWARKEIQRSIHLKDLDIEGSSCVSSTNYRSGLFGISAFSKVNLHLGKFSLDRIFPVIWTDLPLLASESCSSLQLIRSDAYDYGSSLMIRVLNWLFLRLTMNRNHNQFLLRKSYLQVKLQQLLHRITVLLSSSSTGVFMGEGLGRSVAGWDW